MDVFGRPSTPLLGLSAFLIGQNGPVRASSRVGNASGRAKRCMASAALRGICRPATTHRHRPHRPSYPSPARHELPRIGRLWLHRTGRTPHKGPWRRPCRTYQRQGDVVARREGWSTETVHSAAAGDLEPKSAKPQKRPTQQRTA